MSIRPTVAFDLDGTLVDTAPDLVGALNAVLGEAGLGAIDIAEARATIGRGARAMIERGFGLRGATLSEGDIDRLHARFLGHYDEHLTDSSRPYPGAEAALDALISSGAILLVCTNKPERYSVKLLAALGLHGHFRVIAGSDTFPVKKPDPGHLLKAIAKAGGDAGVAAMIGDSAIDVATARAAKVPAVVISHGYADVPVTELGADRIIHRLADVPEAVASLLDPRGPDAKK